MLPERFGSDKRLEEKKHLSAKLGEQLREEQAAAHCDFLREELHCYLSRLVNFISILTREI